MLKPGPIRYARSGDVNIAYQVIGDGPIDVLFVPGFVSHIEMSWDLELWAEFYERMAGFSRFIICDKRGTGLSDRPGGGVTFEERMDDIRAVLDAVDSRRASIVGLSEGGPLATVYAASAPDRVSSLVLWDSAPRFVRGEGWAHAAPHELAVTLVDQVVDDWGTGRGLAPFVAGYTHDPRLVEMMARYERMAASPGAAREILMQNISIDVRDVVPTVHVPALVIHRRGDPLVPLASAEWTASQLPNGELVVLEGRHHTSLDSSVEAEVWDHIEEFLTGRTGHRPSAVDRMLATVLFTDIVSSTERAAAEGDAAWRRLLDRHDSIVRAQLGRWRGTEVKSLGDGFLATFDGPARAVRCATAIRDEARKAGLEVRAGLHTGECEQRAGDVAGIAVHIGARVSALADPGQVLVSQTVKDLVVGSGIDFAPWGTHELKGVPGRWNLFEVTTV